MWRNKVLWTEGMFLRPQHFQQQERYLENLVHRRSRANAEFPWGFETLEIDETALALGKISLRSATGVLPDGTPFACPGEDEPPAPLDVPESLKDTTVFLALALDRPGVAHVSLGAQDGQLPIRSLARDAEVIDVTEGATDAAPLQLGGLRLGLLAAGEVSGAYSAMPVARIVERRSDGQLLLDRQFVAPALDCNALPAPRAWLSEIRGLLRQRCDALASRMVQPGRGGVIQQSHLLNTLKSQQELARLSNRCVHVNILIGTDLHRYLPGNVVLPALRRITDQKDRPECQACQKRHDCDHRQQSLTGHTFTRNDIPAAGQ